MKKIAMRAAALLCCLCLLLGGVSAAKLPTDGYEFPENWSREALIFAVENGILAGDENHDLKAESNITRAEMAAVLVRLLGATEQGDLSAYTDVQKTDWFYTELAAAVGAGVFNGTSDTTMAPNAPITREQAAVVLCRAFGVVSTDRESYKNFTDGKNVSGYARDAVSAMKESKLVNGYSDGTFLPGNPITRAEVAQLLYNLFDCIADTPEEIPASGWVLYRGKDALPKNIAIDGTLVLGQAMPTKLEIEEWSVTGTLVLRTATNTEADLTGLTAGRLVCAPRSGVVSSGVSTVCLWGGGVSYTGVASELIVMGGAHTANGGYPTLDLRGGSLKLNGSSEKVTMDPNTTLDMTGSAEEITMQAGAKLTLGGSVDTLTIAGQNCTVDGAGHAGSVIVGYGGLKLNIAVAHGTANAQKVLDSVRSGEKHYDFIEVMCCPGGCVTGGGQPIVSAQDKMTCDPRALRAAALYREDAGKAKRKSHENAEVQKLYEEFLGHPNSHKAHELLHTHYVKREKYGK